jgi:hypothetical protein
MNTHMCFVMKTYICFCMHTYAPMFVIQVFFQFRRVEGEVRV